MRDTGAVKVRVVLRGRALGFNALHDTVDDAMDREGAEAARTFFVIR